MPKKTKTIETVNKGGRPRKEIDAEGVIKLRSYGLTADEIAKFYNCSRSTLYDKYSDALREGESCLETSLKRTMFELGVNHKNADMLKWLSKNYLGFKDKQPEEIGTTIINIMRKYDLESVENEALKQIDKK